MSNVEGLTDAMRKQLTLLLEGEVVGELQRPCSHGMGHTMKRLVEKGLVMRTARRSETRRGDLAMFSLTPAGREVGLSLKYAVRRGA